MKITSGSIIGPLLVSELLAKKEPVVVISVGSTSSKIETNNTLNTLKSYQVISNKTQMPVVLCYKENSITKQRGEVDAEIQTIIALLAITFSKDNKEIDSSDLKNFLNFPKVTTYSPQLSGLSYFSGEIELEKNEILVSIATLVDVNTSSDIEHLVEYQTVGFVKDIIKQSLNNLKLPIHACIVLNCFNNTIVNLDERLKSYEQLRTSVVDKQITKDDTQATQEGIVL